MNSDMQKAPNQGRPGDDMLEAFARGQLNETDEKRVLVWLMDHPDDLDNILVDDLIGHGLKATDVSAFAHDSRDSDTGVSNQPWLTRVFGQPSVLLKTYAVTSLFLITSLLYLVLKDINGITDSYVHEIDNLRGPGETRRIVSLEDDQNLVLQAFVRGQNSTYSVTLQNTETGTRLDGT